jgi:Conjugal transfer protein TrbL
MFAHALLGDALSIVSHLIVGMVGHFVDGARRDIDSVLNTYLFATVDPHTSGPFTGDTTLHRLNGGMVVAVDALMALVLVAGFFQHMFDHSTRAKFGFKIFIPRMLLAVVLANGSLMFVQMVIDLNNAMGHVAMSLGDAIGSENAPWAAPISPASVDHLKLSEDLFGGIFDIFLVVALVLLALAYVIRTALLNVLVVTAPLAALLMVLPQTRMHATSWLRLLFATVFMQAVQLIVLRVATATAFDTGGGLISTLYALATLFLMLKVPGALNTAEHLETKAHTGFHHLQKSAEKLISPHHSRAHA